MAYSRRIFFCLSGAAAMLPVIARGEPQDYPTRPVRLILPFTPGSPVDAAARIITQPLQTRLGQTIIIENRPGAGTTLGTKAVAAAASDGYTLLLVGDTLGYYPVLYPNLDLDPLKQLTPIATAVTWSHVLVVATSVPANSIAELVAYAKANPGKLVFGFGLGTTPHILGDALRRAAGIELNFVPYRGGEQARADLLGGRVHINIAPVGSLLALIQDGKARPLAYTGATRSPLLPEVPTMIESGFPQVGFNPDVWLGFFGPAGIAPAIISKLNRQINDTLESEEANAALAKLGFDKMLRTPQQFAAFLRLELQKWPPLLRAAGVNPA
jgi:tripartite-type tricarboxylate transporter receptor subunit TctC